MQGRDGRVRVRAGKGVGKAATRAAYECVRDLHIMRVIEAEGEGRRDGIGKGTGSVPFQGMPSDTTVLFLTLELFWNSRWFCTVFPVDRGTMALIKIAAAGR